MNDRTANVVTQAEALLSVAGNPAALSQATVIEQYWDARARTYSNNVRGELAADRLAAWKDILSSRVAAVAQRGEALAGFPSTIEATACGEADGEASAGHTAATQSAAGQAAGSVLAPSAHVRALDLGCGPGFFTAILSGLGCQVTAVDSSACMLDHARENVAAHGNPEGVTYLQSDVASLDVSDASFDLVVLRNVTWLMEDPMRAYEEWRRVLKPCGRLLVFDASWYSYLVDARIDRARRADQADVEILGWDEDARSTEDQDRRCEQIALRLPLTYETRPGWDVQALTQLGFSRIAVDNGVWKRVWSPGEQEFYASSPLFMVEAVK